jgi:hypothetical protein
MNPSDYIQLLILLILTVTLLAIYKQTLVQNNLFKAQLLKDRYDMFLDAYAPVNDEQVRDFKEFPDNFIKDEIYQNKYKCNDKKIRRYITISNLYEYLAFTYKMRSLGVPDLLGENWLEQWTKDLLNEEEFLDVHNSYSGYYPDFEEFVNKLRQQHITSK